MRRKIGKIDEDKCTGCGLCATACAEEAIKIVDGKARLISESYCDGLGACLGECPEDAIRIEEREADPFDEKAVEAARHPAPAQKTPFAACPGSLTREPAMWPSRPRLGTHTRGRVCHTADAASELRHWPVQLKLVAPNAPFLRGADLLLAADCVPFALADFHPRFLRGRSVIIGCPKLDDGAFYVEKLTEIFRLSGIKSVTVLHMEVPCCFGLIRIAETALAASGKNIPLRDVTVSIEGKVLDEPPTGRRA